VKQLGTRKGITVKSRSDGGFNVEFELNGRVLSLSLLNIHDGWKGTSLAVWDPEKKRDLIVQNDDASAEEVAVALSRILEERL
jgi:hypothetical protein